jgi:uncharacterized Zn finger protein
MSSTDTLETLLTSALLRRMAGEVTFERGAAYAQEGRVRDVELTDGTLTAHVEGTETYQVRLWKHGGEVEFDCTCPVGDALRFCKHGVAAGLAWLASRGETDVAAEAAAVVASREKPMERVRIYLAGLDESALRELLLAEAEREDGLRERLLVREAAESTDPAAVERLRAAVDRAADASDFVDYHEVPAYVGGLDRTVDGIAVLAKVSPAAAISLAEHAIRRVERVMGRMDDSDGDLGGVLQRLQELHLDACLAARPDPVPLARRLFKGGLASDYDTFYGAAEAYAEVLGDAGLAEYRRLAQAEWDQLPALVPGERDEHRWGKRYRITAMMELLARMDGDLEALVAIKRRDLSQPHDFLEIAELYRGAGDHDSAMDWARRGLDAFPDRDSRLQLFLADEHHRRGEHEQAMELVWTVFSSRPAFEGYRLLHEHAVRARSWPAWRERALAALREDAAARTTRVGAFHAHHRPDRSQLVRVFLWEDDVEAAWREAREGGCSAELWLELARKRQAGHPADSLGVYREQVDAILVETGERAYEAAVKLLPRVRETMAAVGEDFDAYLSAMRTTHKRRRKLLEMLDRFERRLAAPV